jgi:hypothetical protein
MTSSTAVGRFIEAFPTEALYVDKLYELSRQARELRKEQPALAAPLTLLTDGLSALAEHWDGEPLSPHVADAVTPMIRSAVINALTSPTLESTNALAVALNKARSYPLVSGENPPPIEPQSLS